METPGFGPPEYPYPVLLGRPEHPEINEKSRFSADRKSLTIYLFGYHTKLLSLESAQAWRENLPILSFGLEDEILGFPGAKQSPPWELTGYGYLLACLLVCVFA